MLPASLSETTDLSTVYESCVFCPLPVNPKDPDSYKQILAWVGGKKSDGATLREETHKYAHGDCIKKIKAGQHPSQRSLFDA